MGYVMNINYWMYFHGKGDCPDAHRASAEDISIALHLGLSQEDAEYITDYVAHYTVR